MIQDLFFICYLLWFSVFVSKDVVKIRKKQVALPQDIAQEQDQDFLSHPHCLKEHLRVIDSDSDSRWYRPLYTFPQVRVSTDYWVLTEVV